MDVCMDIQIYGTTLIVLKLKKIVNCFFISRYLVSGQKVSGPTLMFSLTLSVYLQDDLESDDDQDDDLEIHKFNDAEVEVDADDDLAVKKFMST